MKNYRRVPSLQNVRLKRRDHLGIIADMLAIARQGAKKTQIMYKANLSFTQLNVYLSFLLDNGLLRQTISESGEFYIVTEKGAEFFQTHGRLIRMLEQIKT